MGHTKVRGPSYIKRRYKINKTCSKCKVDQCVGNFTKDCAKSDGLRNWCKQCCSKSADKYYKDNKDELLKYGKEYYSNNTEYFKKYRNDNKEYFKEYAHKNIIKINKRRAEYVKNKRKDDVKYKVNDKIKQKINQFIKNKNILPCPAIKYTCKQFRKHIESKFTKGMTWANYGRTGWHIDHIIPYCEFDFNNINDKSLKDYWALSNLQPLWSTTKVAMSHGESVDYIGNVEKGTRILK